MSTPRERELKIYVTGSNFQSSHKTCLHHKLRDGFGTNSGLFSSRSCIFFTAAPFPTKAAVALREGLYLSRPLGVKFSNSQPTSSMDSGSTAYDELNQGPESPVSPVWYPAPDVVQNLMAELLLRCPKSLLPRFSNKEIRFKDHLFPLFLFIFLLVSTHC